MAIDFQPLDLQQNPQSAKSASKGIDFQPLDINNVQQLPGQPDFTQMQSSNPIGQFLQKYTGHTFGFDGQPGSQSLFDPLNAMAFYARSGGLPTSEGTAGVMHGLMTAGDEAKEGLRTLVPQSVKNYFSMPSNMSMSDLVTNGQPMSDDQKQIALQNALYQQLHGKSGVALAGNIVGQVAPYVAGGEALSLGEAPAMLQDSSNIAQYLGMIGKNVGFGLGSAALNPNHNYLASGLVGGVAGALAPALNMLRPSVWMRGDAPAADILANGNAASGTETSLGNVIQDRNAKGFFENILTRLIGSGAGNALQRTGRQIMNRGQGILESLLPDFVTPEAREEALQNIGGTLQTALRDAANDAQVAKRANYNEVERLANESGINVGRQNFATTAQDIINQINQSPELANEIPQSVIQDLERYAGNFEGNNLKLSNIFRGKIGDKANEIYQNSGNTFEHGIYSRLRDALDTDINSEINASGNTELRNAYDEAQAHYRNNIAPFEDPDIVRYIRRGGDPDTIISKFIPNSRINDRSNLLQKLMGKLPEDQQALLRYGYFSRAVKDGRLNPSTLRTLFDSLGTNQRQALFGNTGLDQTFREYSNLVRMNDRALYNMFNPMTGQTNLDAILPAIVSHGVSSGLGGYGGYQHGGVAGGIAGALGGLIGPGLLMRPVTNALTSESFRNALIEQMIRNRPMVNPLSNSLNAISISGANQAQPQDKN